MGTQVYAGYYTVRHAIRMLSVQYNAHGDFFSEFAKVNRNDPRITKFHDFFYFYVKFFGSKLMLYFEISRY